MLRLVNHDANDGLVLIGVSALMGWQGIPLRLASRRGRGRRWGMWGRPKPRVTKTSTEHQKQPFWILEICSRVTPSTRQIVGS